MRASAFGIFTPLEKAHFLAQVALESDGFSAVTEYASGAACEGRKDLGNTHRGDDRRFKGRGVIQVTGRANYRTYSLWKYGDERVVLNPAMLPELPDAVDAVGWYWTVARPKIPGMVRADDVFGVDKAIRGMGVQGFLGGLVPLDTPPASHGLQRNRPDNHGQQKSRNPLFDGRFRLSVVLVGPSNGGGGRN